MELIQSWAKQLCLGALACGIVGQLLPSRMERVGRVALALFLLGLCLSPLRQGSVSLSDVDFSTGSEELSQALVAEQEALAYSLAAEHILGSIQASLSPLNLVAEELRFEEGPNGELELFLTVSGGEEQRDKEAALGRELQKTWGIKEVVFRWGTEAESSPGLN